MTIPPCPTCKGRMLPMVAHFFGWYCLGCGAEWQGGGWGFEMPSATPQGVDAHILDQTRRRPTGLPFKMRIRPDGMCAFELKVRKHTFIYTLTSAQVDYIHRGVGHIAGALRDQARALRDGFSFHFGIDDGKRWARMDEQRLPLEETSIVKPRPCTACGVELVRGAVVFKARPKTPWGWPYGKVDWRNARFCLTCADSKPVGVPVRHLRVLDGGA